MAIELQAKLRERLGPKRQELGQVAGLAGDVCTSFIGGTWTKAGYGKERISLEGLTYFTSGLFFRDIRQQRFGPACVEFRQTRA